MSVDEYILIAAILWGGFGLLVIAAAAGVVLAWRGQRGAALGLLLASSLGLLVFSAIGGFSIGRFTAVVPVLLSGYKAGMGRGRITVGACLLGAALLYIAFSWFLTPLVSTGGILSTVLSGWGILLYIVVAIAAFGWSVLHPPARV